ncbi:hypothetical protein DFH09DRAFT_943705 [Mycena vulgaris]|nr:hypothetical protein DFH09DRAFT_943705 [Mycena vulgaris]
MNNTPHTYTINALRVKSLNCKKKYDCLISLLNTVDPVEYNVLLIQEPPPNLNKFPSLSSPHWTCLTPTFNTTSPDTLLYISKTIPSSAYRQNKIKSSYITSITFTLATDTIHIFSLYNPPDSDDVLHILKLFLATLFPLPPPPLLPHPRRLQ